ncbi:MAG TPA: HD domain-containing phosphohydrolase [Longimicrobium sp.]|nr:HD domain-containing phosphohydrolase [Longimicrobium sp.]
MAHLRRAAAHERAGEWELALQAYDDGYRRAIQLRSPASLLEVMSKLGHCYRQAGRTEDAREVLTLVLEVAELRGELSYAARAMNGLGILHFKHGDLRGAEAAYVRARALAVEAGNEGVQGEVEQNLGIVATIRGDLPEAAARYAAGLKNLEAAGNERGCASVLANLGMLHVDMGSLDEADACFRRSLEICARNDDVVIAGNVHMNRTEMFLARGEPENARASCDEAFETYSRLGSAEGQAEAMKFYGIIHRTLGKLHLAENYLGQSVRIAAEANYPLTEAEAYRELSLVLRALNRNREALEALNRSHALFTGLQARTDQADITDRISQLESDFLSLVRFWGESIEAKDRYTSGHCERVAEYACRIAAEAGVTEREMVWFRMGAFLHDLGKTEVPEEILNKPGRLTDEERAVMERHPVTGDEMLAPVEFPWDIRPMVRSHHERWDGRGYPDGLAAEAIPHSARILRIADVFDALTTARSYRRPLTPEEALAIMEDDEGSFDPALFAIFRAIFDELAGTAARANARAAAESSLAVAESLLAPKA